MGEGFKTRGGGGGIGKLFAAIGVEYPAGSECSCSNGTKTLKAKDTSGKWVFAIPEAGTWTVTSTDGTNSKSLEVEITEQGQSEKVVLSYQLVLLDGADLCEAVTGGWTGYTSVDENGLYMQAWTNGQIAGTKTASTANTFDRGSYTVLKAIVSDADDVGWGNYENTIYSQISFGEAAVIIPETNDEQTVTLELGSVQSGQVAITATGGYYDAVNMYAKIRVKKLWLE